MTVSRSATATSADPAATAAPAERPPGQLPVWRLNVLRIGYFVMGAGLAVTKWPTLFDHEPWELKEGTVVCMLVAMSALALLGLRYPTRMLPILLFEVGWKLTWLAVVALPLWLDGTLHGATREQAAAVLWVIIVIAVIPWRYVLNEYVAAHGEPWRGRRSRLTLHTPRTQSSPRPDHTRPQASS